MSVVVPRRGRGLVLLQHEIRPMSVVAPRRRRGPAFLQHEITLLSVAPRRRRRGPAFLYSAPSPSLTLLSALSARSWHQPSSPHQGQGHSLAAAAAAWRQRRLQCGSLAAARQRRQQLGGSSLAAAAGSFAAGYEKASKGNTFAHHPMRTCIAKS
jgi:hypothetical protein